MKRSFETESKIIQAALEIFVRKGYQGTSVEEITRKVGLTKGALYAHFRSKGEVLLRIVDEYRSKFLGGMVDALERVEGDALDKIHRVISYNSKFVLEHQDLVVFFTFVTSELRADVDFEPALKGAYREYVGIITDIVRHGIRQGLFKKELDADATALTFMALHDGVLHHWVLNRYRIDGSLYVRTFREIFLNGLVREGVAESRRQLR
ncbi:MAG TPA: TetR/AcrR family transcriptional regulator [Desulfomonilaceae bacterium]|nr:TetR/AcrR family transcriptional regulator [Desulfomonilaceae bacterium]